MILKPIFDDDFIVLFAAGNDGDKGVNTVNSPGISKNIITVGSVGTRKTGYNNENYVSYYSGRGPTSTFYCVNHIL